MKEIKLISTYKCISYVEIESTILVPEEMEEEEIMKVARGAVPKDIDVPNCQRSTLYQIENPDSEWLYYEA